MTHSFQRSMLTLGEGLYPVLSHGRKAWLFVHRKPLPLPSLLLRMPSFLAWLLRDVLKPQESNTLAVTVIPQMSCNAACHYCIQNVQVTATSVQRVAPAWMTDAAIEATVAFIESQRVAQGREGVNLTVFGGEPLLNPERCYRLLERVEHLKGASIVTNGILLTPEVAQGLSVRGVDSVQITFDGAREQHDAVRILAANGGGTYDTIVANLAQIDSLPVLPNRQLRVNVTASNVHQLQSLVEDLASHLNPKRWLLYFALVDDNGIGWNDGLIPAHSIGQELASLARFAAKLGFKQPIPGPVECGFCTQTFGQGGMVINADGKLSSCWDSAGFPDMVVGDVYQGYADATANHHKWVQCGYRSRNQGTLADAGDELAELAWTLRELAVAAA